MATDVVLIQFGVAGEIIAGETLAGVEGKYHPDLIAQMVEVPAGSVVSGQPWDATARTFGQLVTVSLDPVPGVPQQITPYQARKALLDAGVLGQVEAAVAVAPQEVRLAWEYALVIERQSPLIQAMSQSLGLSSEQVDALFIAAGALSS